MSQDFNLNSSPRHCVHTKNIYGLLDAPKNEKMQKHIENCAACSQELKAFTAKAIATQTHIPKVIMDRDLRQSFEREVGELFKVMNLTEREALKRNVKERVSFLDKMGADYLANLASKNMIKIYLIAAAMFFVLKHFK